VEGIQVENQCLVVEGSLDWRFGWEDTQEELVENFESLKAFGDS